MEELARRLGNREILLRNYMVLIPWWQANADYTKINGSSRRRGSRRRCSATTGRSD